MKNTVVSDDVEGEHVVDGAPDIFPHSHSYHVPVFTLSVSIIEVNNILCQFTNNNITTMMYYCFFLSKKPAFAILALCISVPCNWSQQELQWKRHKWRPSSTLFSINIQSIQEIWGNNKFTKFVKLSEGKCLFWNLRLNLLNNFKSIFAIIFRRGDWGRTFWSTLDGFIYVQI